MADSEVEAVVAQAVADEVVKETEVVEAMKETEAPKDDDASAVEDVETPAGDHKRKLEALEPDQEDEAPRKKQDVSTAVPAPVSEELGSGGGDDAAGGLENVSELNPSGMLVSVEEEAKLDNTESSEPKVDDSGNVNGDKVEGDALEKHPDGESNGSVAAAEKGDELQNLETEVTGNGQVPFGQELQSDAVSDAGVGTSSSKIEVPNNKVGVLIGKSGETIRFLQLNSGAKIQITRDSEADPNSTSRPVELIGSLESIKKAEKLIKDVIAEAEAGGSPSLVARGFSTIQSGGEQFEIKVPNEKVGVIIGKGGETIKNLQTRSGARIQLIPQHLPEGDSSKERTVRITGDRKQIESAKEMIKEVMNQTPIKPSPLSGHSHQNYRPRGHNMPHWGGRSAAPTQQTMGYDYQQRSGTYPSQTVQYPYGGYSQQAAPRGSFSGSSWDHRPTASVQPSGGYDYYSQGGHQTSMPNPGSAQTPASYGQTQPPNYGHSAPFGQAAPTQNYGHGYNEPRYDNQAQGQQFYGQQNMGSQPGVYGQGTAPQPGFSQQQPYAKSPYGVPPQDAQAYGVPPRASQPGDPAYQGSAPSSYGSGPPAQQYPYASNPAQQAPYNQSYGPSSGSTDGYAQQPSAYQHGGQALAPAYAQGGQPVSAYAQPSAQPTGYAQYASSQQGYGDNSANYGYQGGSGDAAYANTVPASGYGVPPAGVQPGYPQQPSNAAGYYDQSVAPQAGYANHPGNAQGYTKSVSPQPAYGAQYDSTQMYAHH